jgi:steroid delta-isomerase-like uncharacterized protein
MSPETIHREAYAAWNARDFDRMRTMFHPEYTYIGPDGVESPGVDSAMAVAQLFASAFPDAKVIVDRVFLSGDTAIAECTGRGTHDGDFLGNPASQRPVTVTLCNIIQIRDGLIYREREYFDMATVLAQIGASRLPTRTAGA